MAIVRSELAALGVPVTELVPAREQSVGSAAYVGRDAEGPLQGARARPRRAGRAAARQALALLSYRDPPHSAPVGRVEQVEHEALATLMAARAGARVPRS